MQIADLIPFPIKRPRRLSRLALGISSTLLQLLMFTATLLAVSNPRKGEYVNYMSNELIAQVQAPAIDQCTTLPLQFQGVCNQTINTFSTGLEVTQADKLERYISNATQYQNYVLFSIYKLNIQGIDNIRPTTTLGVLGQFISIETK